MRKNLPFQSGFLEGWHSIVGPQTVFPDIPPPPERTVGTLYMAGLLKGIELGRLHMAAQAPANAVA